MSKKDREDLEFSVMWNYVYLHPNSSQKDRANFQVKVSKMSDEDLHWHDAFMQVRVRMASSD